MHGDGDLRLKLSKDFSGEIGCHGAAATNRCERDINFAEGFDLLLIQLLTQVTKMRDAERAQVEDERRTFDAFDKFGVLMDRYVVDQSVFEARADFVPVRAVVFQAAQDQRITQNDLHGIVIEHLLADGNDVADDVGVRIPTGAQGIGDDTRALAGRNEKEVMTEILNRRIDIRGVSERSIFMRDIRIAACGLSGRDDNEQGSEGNCKAKDDASNPTLTKVLHDAHEHTRMQFLLKTANPQHHAMGLK